MYSPLDSTSERARTAGFIVLGLAQVAIYGLLAVWKGYQTRPHYAMLLALCCFAFYLTALLTAPRPSGRQYLFTTIIFGMAFRFLLFPEPPFFSDDHFRYLWDGVVQRAGLNPYRYAPVDPALAGINDALRARVNHPEIRTIYPPLAQLVFWVTAMISAGSLLTLKTAWVICDLAIAALLYRLVPAKRRFQALLFYWWSPLVIIEVYWNAHLDLLGVVFVVAALALSQRVPIKSYAIGIAVGSASLVKYFAVAFLPGAARGRWPYRLLAGFALVVALASVRYVNAGIPVMFEGLGTYARHWSFNAGLYRVLEWVLISPSLAKTVAAATVVCVVISSLRNRWSIEKTIVWITGAILLLSPTVHPWYLLWMVPLLAVRPNRAWTYLTGSVFLAYFGLSAYRTTGVWIEPWWLPLLIYGPFYALLMADWWSGSWWQAAWEAIRIAPRSDDP